MDCGCAVTDSDLQEVYLPAADAKELQLRVYTFVPLPSW